MHWTNLSVKPWQNEDTLGRQHCVLQCCPSVAKRGNIVARRADTRNVSEDFQKHFLCPPLMLCAWQNESTFGKHDDVSNVAATTRPRFAGPYKYRGQLSSVVTALTSVKTSFCAAKDDSNSRWAHDRKRISTGAPYSHLVGTRIRSFQTSTMVLMISKLLRKTERVECSHLDIRNSTNRLASRLSPSVS